jgi:lysophospholipase L1-like esterase
MTIRSLRLLGVFATLLTLFIACGSNATDTSGSGGTTSVGTGGSSNPTGGGRGPTPAGGSGGEFGTGGTETGGDIGSGGTTVDGGIGGVSDSGSGGLAGSDSGSGRGGQSGAGGQSSSGGTGGSGPSTAGGNITVWMAGDSTMANDGGTSCPIGWGTQFQPFFNNLVTVVDSAAAGTSINTWLYAPLTTKNASGECNLTKDASGNPVVQARWQNMLNTMKSGDYLLIAFGINDGGTCPRYEGDEEFIASLGVMAKAAKARGTQPIFLTPTSSISCQGSTAVGTRGRFVTDTINAGTQNGVTVINLHQLSVDFFNANQFCPLAGGAKDITATTGGAAGAFFCNDHTHFEISGAKSIAKLVSEAIRNQNLSLAAYLN